MATTNSQWIKFLEQIGTTSVISETRVTIKDKIQEPDLLPYPIDALFEVYGNLILAGFTEKEALQIVCTVVTNGKRTN